MRGGVNGVPAPASTPAVTVALSVYNDAGFVAQAIESVLAQSFTDFEFLIVNDGSSDQSPAIIDAFAARDPRVRVIHQDNRGLIASLNRLIEEARAPLIARMDGDDICLPERLAMQVAFMAAEPACGAVGAQSRDIDMQGRAIPGLDHKPLDHAGIVAQLGKSSPLCHPVVMMRTDLVRRLGGYRAAYRYCEDFDLWLRMAEVAELRNLPEILLEYRRSPDQVSERNAIEQHYGAQIALLAHKEREAGRPDPTESLAVLPPIERLDAVFGREGVSTQVRGKLALGLVYSREAMRGEGFRLLAEHVRSGGRREGLWRTSARLMLMGEPLKSARLSLLLLSRALG